MADIRVTQNPVEVVYEDSGDIRNSQNPVEVIIQVFAPIRFTQEVIEVVGKNLFASPSSETYVQCFVVT